MPGHAGNFLSRLFGLSPETIPQLPTNQMKQLLAQGNGIDPHLNRIELYYFSNALNQHTDWQQFHRSWPDFIEKDLFNMLNIDSDFRYKSTVYSIHPHEFILNQTGIYSTSDQFFHVELKGHDSWVADQQQRLKFEWRERELEQFQQIVEEYPTEPINLTGMLVGEQEFLNEYQRVCQIMDVTALLDLALALYQDWRSVRYPYQ